MGRVRAHLNGQDPGRGGTLIVHVGPVSTGPGSLKSDPTARRILAVNQPKLMRQSKAMRTNIQPGHCLLPSPPCGLTMPLILSGCWGHDPAG